MRTRLPLAETIRSRRSVRRFRPDPLPDSLLDEILDTAVEAPSSWNFQSRSVVAVRDPGNREALARAANGQRQVREAPVTLVFVAETDSWREALDDICGTAVRNGAWNDGCARTTATAGAGFQDDLAARGLLREYAVKDAMIAATYVMLAAADAGLGTSPMNGWDEAEVKKVIGAEHRDDLAAALLLSVGRPAERRAHPGRRPRGHTVFGERHGRALV
ncbi:nitroreductase [Nocardiopsis sp. TSRI0078]|uniref:nitroreductase family protein n=1 Tax=unclassified Nocardiopsis TaxID=2649073 RepID=UPI0009395966|nr:nitroreductase family protein [Nocardiopsis sp. TSRI0078]OKI23504.1 nitroreductase [Nocardiopsis sp. TSRI0078]